LLSLVEEEYSNEMFAAAIDSLNLAAISALIDIRSHFIDWSYTSPVLTRHTLFTWHDKPHVRYGSWYERLLMSDRIWLYKGRVIASILIRLLQVGARVNGLTTLALTTHPDDPTLGDASSSSTSLESLLSSMQHNPYYTRPDNCWRNGDRSLIAFIDTIIGHRLYTMMIPARLTKTSRKHNHLPRRRAGAFRYHITTNIAGVLAPAMAREAMTIFLMATHARVGGGTSISNHFLTNRLYDRHMLRYIFDSLLLLFGAKDRKIGRSNHINTCHPFEYYL
jgi:hypothetical protein